MTTFSANQGAADYSVNRVTDLLSGPRGRRMLFEFVTSSPHATENGLNRAVFSAAAHLDPRRGVTAVFRRAGSNSNAEFPDPVTPAAIAHLITSTELAIPDNALLLECLQESVNSARYWQEPDGRDILTRSPEVHRALESVAAYLVMSPLIDWWWSPVDRSGQWATSWNKDMGSLDSGSLNSWRQEAHSSEERSRSRDQKLRSPHEAPSGQWWSAPVWGALASTRNLPGVGGSTDDSPKPRPVGAELVEDWNGEEVHTEKFTPAANSRILELCGTDAAAKWSEVCRRYPLDVTWSHRHDWYLTTGRDSAKAGTWLVPDWASVAEEWDAVHLTVSGYLAAAGTIIPIVNPTTFSTGPAASVISGWGPDETFWLTSQR